MKITFLGVGEACDPRLGNTSVLARTGPATLLLDCGFTVPHALFQEPGREEALDAVWISHLHGDHFLGLPLLFLRLNEAGRARPLELIGGIGLENAALAALELAYPGFHDKLGYELIFHEILPDEHLDLLGLSWTCALSGHARPNLALRLEDGRTSLFYSGDGNPTAATTALAAGCDLVIHEAFLMENQVEGHGSVKACEEVAAKARPGRMLLAHLEHGFRERHYKEIAAALSGFPCPAGLASPGQEVEP